MAYPEEELKTLKRHNLKKELETIKPRELSKKSDADLAFWQSEFEPNSPQYRLAEQEWQRRLIVSQIRTTRYAALVGILGTLVGALSTYLLAEYW